jgi:hypothetical protein
MTIVTYSYARQNLAKLMDEADPPLRGELAGWCSRRIAKGISNCRKARS